MFDINIYSLPYLDDRPDPRPTYTVLITWRLLSPDLDSAIAAHELVISLVPYIYNAEISKLAIKNKVNGVTTSYVSPAIRELDFAAKVASIVVLSRSWWGSSLRH